MALEKISSPPYRRWRLGKISIAPLVSLYKDRGYSEKFRSLPYIQAVDFEKFQVFLIDCEAWKNFDNLSSYIRRGGLGKLSMLPVYRDACTFAYIYGTFADNSPISHDSLLLFFIHGTHTVHVFSPPFPGPNLHIDNFFRDAI